MGKIVLFLVPIPKSLKEPSYLYKNVGCNVCIKKNKKTKRTIEKETQCFLIKLFILN